MPRFLQHLRVHSRQDGSDNHSRSRSRSRSRGAYDPSYLVPGGGGGAWQAPGFSTKAGHLPDRILARIFHHVAPHCSDETYKSVEDSLGLTGEGCVLCETRDLAACMQVNRRWSVFGARHLYRNIRLDAVHYCDREEYLSERRKNKHRPEDQQEKRLKLLERTLRERQHLAQLVEILKVPYMTREGYKPDLARIVSCTMNLRYVDLPDGLFSDSPSCLMLKGELQARCPDLRFMKYKAGSETSFAQHVHGNLWYNLEVLGLEELDLEPDVLTYALANLSNLRKLSMERMGVLRDDLFTLNELLPPLPAVRTLRLVDAPQLSAWGLSGYLRRPEVASVMVSLQLENTGVQPSELHAILDSLPRLHSLIVRGTVPHALPATNIPPLASRSLRTFHFEILPESSHTLGNVAADSYYNYLANSLTAAGFPSLRSLYAYYPALPDLLIASPNMAFPGGHESPQPPMSTGHSGKSPRLQAPASPGYPPRLSAMPGSLVSPQSAPSMAPSMANRMSTLSLNPPPSPFGSIQPGGNALAYHNNRDRSSSGAGGGGLGYSTSPFSPSRAQLAQASAPTPAPPHLARNLGITAPLKIFTKPPEAEEMEWLVTVIEPPAPGARGAGGVRAARPLSLFGLEPSLEQRRGKVVAPSGLAVGGGDDLDWLADPGDARYGGEMKVGMGIGGADAGRAGQQGLVGKGGGQLVGNGFGGYVEVKDEGKKGRRKGTDWMG